MRLVSCLPALLLLCFAAAGSPSDVLAPAQSLADAARALALPAHVLPGSAEGLEVILGVLSSRAAVDSRAAAAALSALARVADAEPPGPDGSAPALVRAALEGGALESLTRAMGAYPGNAAVSGAGCAALYALSRHALAQAPAGQLGALGLACEALVTHGGSAAVVGMCAHALMHLAVLPANKAHFADAQAPRALVAAMRRHGGDAFVARTGCGALNNGAAGHADNKAAVVAAGGLDAVVGALRAHRRDAAAAERACGALAVLCTGDGAAQRAAQAGGVEAAAAALEAHLGIKKPRKGSGRQPRPPSPRVAAACARALAALAWNEHHIKRAARDALVPELLRAAAELFPGDQQVSKWAQKALEKITDPVVEQMFEGACAIHSVGATLLTRCAQACSETSATSDRDVHLERDALRELERVRR